MAKAYLDLVITPGTWPTQASLLKRTPSGLFNLIGWFGSTHASAAWRKDRNFLNIFAENNFPGFDPQIDDWDPSYAQIEAEVMASASVIVIRLENHELINGSLGSVAEIGLALVSAVLRGQTVVVSIEDKLLATLNEPGAIAQYMMLEMWLEQIAGMKEFNGLLRIHRGDDLTLLATTCCLAAKHRLQKNGAGLIDFGLFLEKRERRRQNYPKRVLLGGSGGAYAELRQPSFLAKRDLLMAAFPKTDYSLKILSEGVIAKAWQIPYGSIDHLGMALATRTLLAIETDYKQEADILLLPLMAEAASKAAATEIGFLLLYALTTGQDIRVYLEPFDPVDFIRCQLDEVEISGYTTEKEMRLALLQAGVASQILAVAVKTEVEETFTLFKAMLAGASPTLGQVKQSLLGQTGAYQQADNIRRVRALVQAHLERLVQSPRFPNFFSYSTQLSV
jgi:hypothetical protein